MNNSNEEMPDLNEMQKQLDSMETIEQLQKIIDNAPAGSTHIEGASYLKLDGYGDTFWDDGWWYYKFLDSQFIRSLSDIKRIIELQKQVDELNEYYGARQER